jgi:AcrR family transcriptional regulator
VARASATAAGVGRPRRFDDETERRMIVDAAIRVFGAADGGPVSVGDVLAEAGLSTRAFYRHFESKEALLEALMLHEAAAVARSLTRVVARAPDPVAALEAWLQRYLDVFYEPRRAARASLLTSASYQASRPSAQMVQEMRRMSCAPLADALRRGHAAGVLSSPTPEADAYAIYDLVNAYRQACPEPDRAGTVAHVVRFAWPALHLAP